MKSIDLKLTVHEAEWLRNALLVASNASEVHAPMMSKWTKAFALGLDQKITNNENEQRNQPER